MIEVTYAVTVHNEGPDGYWAEIDELPGCFASGMTMAELDEALDEAVGIYLSAADGRVVATPVREAGVHHVQQRYLVDS